MPLGVVDVGRYMWWQFEKGEYIEEGRAIGLCSKVRLETNNVDDKDRLLIPICVVALNTPINHVR